jgi:DNA mismatch repair ATPase MutL
MTPDDMLLAVERHRHQQADRGNGPAKIATLEFRGEALPSMAAFTRLTITSSAVQDGGDGRSTSRAAA